MLSAAILDRYVGEYRTGSGQSLIFRRYGTMLVAKAFAFIAISLVVSRYLSRAIERTLERMPREFFLLFSFALLIGMSAVAERLGL